MDRQRIETILCRYVDRMKPHRSHWIVETTDGKRWLGKKIARPDHLQWWSAVDGELRSRGFLSMPAFYTDGRSYVLTPWIHGKMSSYQDLDQAMMLMKQLAFFHQAGTGLQTPPKKEVAFLFYERLYTRLKRFYRLMRKLHHIPGEVGRFLSHVGPLFYQDGYQTWIEVTQLPLQMHTDWNHKYHFLAHRDLASHNWLIDQKQQGWLIDFDTAEYDSQLGDLWQMLTRIMAEHDWDQQVFVRLLSSYESIRPLDKVEKKILVTLLGFPNEFFREAIGLCMRKEGYHYRSTFPYLQRLAKNRLLWQKQIAYIPSW